MKITFIGVGYVGLVTGIMMAHLGHKITCLDNDKNKIDQLKNGQLPIYEEHLSHYLHQAIATNSINFTYNYDQSLAESQVIFITVGTPSSQDGSVDLKYIKKATLEIAKFVDQNVLIVIKSTVPPGTCVMLKQLIKDNYGADLEVASNPEFLREGIAIHDFLNPDRVIIGTQTKRAQELLRSIYVPLTNNIIATDLQTAELIKYSSNAFLAIKIAFINEMANLCEEIGANINELSLGMGLDPRIGKDFLKAGPGFGGSCFPKDNLGLATFANSFNVNVEILNAAIRANKNRPGEMVDKIVKILGDIKLHESKLCVLGLSFKARTDDVRDSPAIEIIKLLTVKGAKIAAYDPKAMDNSRKILPELEYAGSLAEIIQDAKIIIILTEWQEFKEFDWAKCVNNKPIIIDFRNILDYTLIKQLGLKYYSIGRKIEIL